MSISRGILGLELVEGDDLVGARRHRVPAHARRPRTRRGHLPPARFGFRRSAGTARRFGTRRAGPRRRDPRRRRRHGQRPRRRRHRVAGARRLLAQCFARAVRRGAALRRHSDGVVRNGMGAHRRPRPRAPRDRAQRVRCRAAIFARFVREIGRRSDRRTAGRPGRYDATPRRDARRSGSGSAGRRADVRSRRLRFASDVAARVRRLDPQRLRRDARRPRAHRRRRHGARALDAVRRGRQRRVGVGARTGRHVQLAPSADRARRNSPFRQRSAEPRDGQLVLARALRGAHRKPHPRVTGDRAALGRRYRLHHDDGRSGARAAFAPAARTRHAERRSGKRPPATTRICATKSRTSSSAKSRPACRACCNASRARRGRRATGSRSIPGARSTR